VARQCSDESVDYPRDLLRMTELELLDRELRATERRIQHGGQELGHFRVPEHPVGEQALVLELAQNSETISSHFGTLRHGHSGRQTRTCAAN